MSDREAFENLYPLAVFDEEADGYTDSMYSYAFVGFIKGVEEGRAQALDELKPMIKRFMLFVEDSYSTNDEYYIQAKKLLEGSNNEG